MFQLTAGLFCILSVACVGQIPNLDRQLASSEPRDVAWAAYTIGLQKQYGMVPKLVELVASFEGGASVDQGPIPPAAAAMEAIADSLIQLEAKLPAAVIMHLYPRFPAQTIILLSRASDNSGPLMEIFQQTKSRDLWLAAGNLLAVHPPSGFARALLGGAVTTFWFRVTTDAPPGEGGTAGGGGCAGDSFMTSDENFQDWPKVRLYRILHSENASNIFAPGIHRVSFSSWETTDYRDSWEDGDCTASTSKYWRSDLIAQLLVKKMSELPIQPELAQTILFTSKGAFEERIKSSIEQMSRAFAEVVEAFVQSGQLTIEDSTALHLKCRMIVSDERPLPHTDLPEINGRWCAAPPADANFQLP